MLLAPLEHTKTALTRWLRGRKRMKGTSITSIDVDRLATEIFLVAVVRARPCFLFDMGTCAPSDLQSALDATCADGLCHAGTLVVFTVHNDTFVAVVSDLLSKLRTDLSSLASTEPCVAFVGCSAALNSPKLLEVATRDTQITEGWNLMCSTCQRVYDALESAFRTDQGGRDSPVRIELCPRTADGAETSSPPLDLCMVYGWLIDYPCLYCPGYPDDSSVDADDGQLPNCLAMVELQVFQCIVRFHDGGSTPPICLKTHQFSIPTTVLECSCEGLAAGQLKRSLAAFVDRVQNRVVPFTSVSNVPATGSVLVELHVAKITQMPQVML